MAKQKSIIRKKQSFLAHRAVTRSWSRKCPTLSLDEIKRTITVLVELRRNFDLERAILRQERPISEIRQIPNRRPSLGPQQQRQLPPVRRASVSVPRPNISAYLNELQRSPQASQVVVQPARSSFFVRGRRPSVTSAPNNASQSSTSDLPTGSASSKETYETFIVSTSSVSGLTAPNDTSPSSTPDLSFSDPVVPMEVEETSPLPNPGTSSCSSAPQIDVNVESQSSKLDLPTNHPASPEETNQTSPMPNLGTSVCDLALSNDVNNAHDASHLSEADLSFSDLASPMQIDETSPVPDRALSVSGLAPSQLLTTDVTTSQPVFPKETDKTSPALALGTLVCGLALPIDANNASHLSASNFLLSDPVTLMEVDDTTPVYSGLAPPLGSNADLLNNDPAPPNEANETLPLSTVGQLGTATSNDLALPILPRPKMYSRRPSRDFDMVLTTIKEEETGDANKENRNSD